MLCNTAGARVKFMVDEWSAPIYKLFLQNIGGNADNIWEKKVVQNFKTKGHNPNQI